MIMPTAVMHPDHWRHAHMQAGLSAMTKKTAIENRKTVNAQQASIIMNSATNVSITEATEPSRRTHPVNGHHAGNACSPIRNHAASHAVFYRSFCFPILPFPVMRPFLWSVAAETRYEAEITETAKHTAPESKTNHASIHSSCETPWNCIMTRF